MEDKRKPIPRTNPDTIRVHCAAAMTTNMGAPMSGLYVMNRWMKASWHGFGKKQNRLVWRISVVVPVVIVGI